MLEEKYLNFIEQIIEDDIKAGFDLKNIKFRFPPEPNGYLHIGHAKAICLNFGLAKKYNTSINLRFDDTNPEAEEQEFVDAIKEDIKWLGFVYNEERYASDYFQQLYEWAIQLIKEGKAYVDDQPSELIVEQRKSVVEPGVDSMYRNRTVEENLLFFEKMKNGEGSSVLRAKIDMAHPNMNMRDPVMYRILNRTHHRTLDKWKIYPMYDWAHGQSDYIEGISHSLCSLEFENHRPLYEWYVNSINLAEIDFKPKQREFSRGNVSYMITSKRKLKKLVEEKKVTSWDDPRMPTISGLRRRGYTPNSIIKFWETVGVSKRENLIDISLLEFHLRQDLSPTAKRVMVVLNPLKIIIDNYEALSTEFLIQENNSENPTAGNRKVPFGKEIYIEREDFLEEAPNNFFRLTLGKEVRLKGAYIIKANTVEKDDNNEIKAIHVTYDKDSKSGSGTEASNRKVKGTIHWVESSNSIPVEVRLYDRLFSLESPEETFDTDFNASINEDSLKVVHGFAEPELKNAVIEEKFQFQRLGYFTLDKESVNGKYIFNRTATLKDTWSKINKTT